MKRRNASTWILAGLWLLAVLGVGASHWIITAQESTAQELARAADEVEQAVLAGRWGEAEVLAQELRQAWDHTRKVWALHTEHAEMDVITDALTDTLAWIRIQDPGALVPLRRARERILTLPHQDRLKLENLF